MIRQNRFVLFVAVSILASAALAQNYSSSNNSRSRYRPRLATNYFYQNPGNSYQLNPYATGAGTNPYSLSPYMNYRAPAAPQRASLPPVTGPVTRYSPLEYGEIVKMTVEAARKNNPGAELTSHPTIIKETTSTVAGAAPTYSPVSTSVSDILDRGIILVPTGEEVRLRGVIIPSNTDSNEVSRLYAKEAIQVLRNITHGKEIYILLDDPVRDGAGRILGTILLADGTELNRRMIEMGYGTVKPEDFGPTVDFADMSVAQQDARKKRLGIWSASF